MEDKISQFFKVQWLNTTLKFVKDDNRMVIEYPQMPIAQVEYLHNLIWQRQNNVGLGFKSLYSPLWEAMNIFSVKYQFQVSITKATTGDLGQLKIQKISKTTNEECNKPPLEPNNREIQSPVYEKPIIMQQSSKSSNEECTKVVLLKNPNDQLSSGNDTDNSSNKLLKALKAPEHSTDNHNASIFITSFDSRTIDNTDIETDDEFDATDNEKSMVCNNAAVKNAQNTEQTNYETKCDIINNRKFTLKKVSSTENKSKKEKSKRKAVKESKMQETSEKDSNNNAGSKEVKPNAWTEVVSPTKNISLILLVQLKTKKCPEKIASLIARKINSEIESRPHLKCHGVQDNYIVYSSYKKKSYLWLKNLLTDYRVIDYKGMDEIYVLQIKINASMDCEKVLNLLEKHNPGLNSNEWVIVDVTYLESSIEFLAQVGFSSFEHIRSNHFMLHAGVDEVQFAINIAYYSSYLQV